MIRRAASAAKALSGAFKYPTAYRHSGLQLDREWADGIQGRTTLPARFQWVRESGRARISHITLRISDEPSHRIRVERKVWRRLGGFGRENSDLAKNGRTIRELAEIDHTRWLDAET